MNPIYGPDGRPIRPIPSRPNKVHAPNGATQPDKSQDPELARLRALHNAKQEPEQEQLSSEIREQLELSMAARQWLAERYPQGPRIALGEGALGTLHPTRCRCGNCYSIAQLEDQLDLDEDEMELSPDEKACLSYYRDG